MRAWPTGQRRKCTVLCPGQPYSRSACAQGRLLLLGLGCA